MIARVHATTREQVGPMLLAGVVGGLMVAAVYRRGAIHNADAAVVGFASAVVVVLCLVRSIDRSAIRVVVPLAGLAAWWMASAALHDVPVRFLPLGASILAFLAALLAVRALTDPDRTTVAGVIVGVGAASAVIGLVAEGLRWFPLAERAQHLWRVSTTLSYSNAAGLLFVVALLVAAGMDARRPLVRVGLCLCTAGFIATQSRGAALALVVGLLLVPRAHLKAALWPAVAGLAAGLVAVATSQENATQPMVIAVAALAAVAAAAVRPPTRQWRLGWRWVVGVACIVIAGGVVAGLVLRTPIERRVNDDRSPEWSAALRQWESSPLLGVGPDKPLVVTAATRTVTSFAESEYLQVLAGAGVIGEALLVVSGVAVASALTRRDGLAAGGAAAVIAFAAAGSVDFVWHLPALALVTGAAAGLSARPPGEVTSRVKISSEGLRSE